MDLGASGCLGIGNRVGSVRSHGGRVGVVRHIPYCAAFCVFVNSCHRVNLSLNPQLLSARRLYRGIELHLLNGFNSVLVSNIV